MITVSGFLDDHPVDVEVELRDGEISFETKGFKQKFHFCAEFANAMHLVPHDGFFIVSESPRVHIPGPEVKRIIDKLKQTFMREANISNVAYSSMALSISEPFLVFYGRLKSASVPEKILESACDTFLNGLITMVLRGSVRDEE